jgi:hypothetical protein
MDRAYNFLPGGSMHAKGLSKLAGAIAAMTLFTVGLTAQTSGTSLGSVKIPAVTANGQALPAGTYTLRLSGDAVTPVVGQSADAAKWVEFVQGGQVKGKELATVVPRGRGQADRQDGAAGGWHGEGADPQGG